MPAAPIAEERAPLGLYVHWPWCRRKCPYCDFNSQPLSGPAPEAAYLDALLRDLDALRPLVDGRPVSSVFIGGGTPSLISAGGMDRLLRGIADRVTLAADREITAEANPGAAQDGLFASWAVSGVNRLSLGVQSFSDRALTTLGRLHDGAAARAAARAALRACANVNLDLMFALPGQDEGELESDLSQLIELAPPHVSYYELTIEEGTAFGRHPPPGLPDPDRAAALAGLVAERLSGAGWERYEVSAWARPGRRCRHNLSYWRHADYLGIGAGAHGKITRGGTVYRYSWPADPRRYLSPDRPARPADWRAVAPSELPFEFALNVLRLRDGVATERWRETTGRPLSDIAPVLAGLRRRGLLVPDPGRIAASELGWRFLSDAQEAFLS